MLLNNNNEEISKQKYWIKTYSNINNNIIIPKLCIGIDDFILLFSISIIFFFAAIFLNYFLALFISKANLYIISFLIIAYNVIIYIYFKIRGIYIKKREANIIGQKIDYYLENNFLPGRFL